MVSAGIVHHLYPRIPPGAGYLSIYGIYLLRFALHKINLPENIVFISVHDTSVHDHFVEEKMDLFELKSKWVSVVAFSRSIKDVQLFQNYSHCT
jgi:hypothetical protein